jgi:pilus assembly protein Flp/PilA
MELLARFGKDESGVTAIEYGLISALVAIVIVGSLIALGGGLTNTFNQVSASLP